MRQGLRRRITVLLGLTVSALLAVFAVDDVVNLDTPASSEEGLAVPAATAPGTFPVRSVPGAASAIAQEEPRLSTGLASLGLGPQAVVFANESLGPPAWVKPGTRVTFYSAAASVAQSRFAWVEDPDGDWEDPVTGKRYRRTDETGESMGSASGDGFSQIDVLAIDGTDVVLSLALYGIDRSRSTHSFVPGATTGAKVAGAQIDGTWIHPARLAQLQEVRADGLLVLRGNYPLNGTTYKAISFAVSTPGAYQQYTYDTQSGLLLSATTRTDGAPSPVTGPDETPPQGNQYLTVTFFAGARQRTMPGVNGVNPDWVDRTSRLNYTGTYVWTNPVDPSTGALTSPMTMDVSLRPGGDAWASYAARTSIQAIGSTATGSGVTGPTGIYWLSQQALAALVTLPARRLVDKDPITGEQLSVQSVGRDPATGRNLLILASRLPGITTLGGYDMTTGVLAAYAAQVLGSGSTINLQLQGGP